LHPRIQIPDSRIDPVKANIDRVKASIHGVKATQDSLLKCTTTAYVFGSVFTHGWIIFLIKTSLQAYDLKSVANLGGLELPRQGGQRVLQMLRETVASVEPFGTSV
jgi:hypothetical protein